MAKIKVGAPAVSRYYQIRSILPASYQEHLNDHEFPVPGYLLAAYDYMFLEPSQSNITESEIFNSSICEQESPTEYLDFGKMMLNGHKGTIFEVLSHQMMLHLNVSVIPKECKEILDEAKKENENLDFENLSTNEVFLISQTPSSVFLSNIVIFYSVESQYQHIAVKAKDKSIEGPLHIF